MPRTGIKASPKLAIELTSPKGTYQPGDALTGVVKCESPPEPQPAFTMLRLTLWGRAKTKYIVQSQNGKDISRGRASLFHVQQILHKGQMDSARTWPFTISIPNTPQKGGSLESDVFKPDPSYLSNKDDISGHELPSVLYYFSESGMSGKTVEAYVEYVLTAQLGETQATLPLYLLRPGTNQPITEYKMRSSTRRQCIKSHALLQEHANKPRTFRQTMQRTFRPSKIPRWTINIKVEYPTIIQLEHPDPIPLRVHVIHDADPQWTNICPDGDLNRLPPVRIVSMSMKLISLVAVRCSGMIFDSSTTKEHNSKFNFRLPLKPTVIPLAPTKTGGLGPVLPVPETQPLVSAEHSATMSMPNMHNHVQYNETPTQNGYKQDAVVTEPSNDQGTLHCQISDQPLDLGKHLSILLGCSAASTQDHNPVSFKRQIYPSFKTYNIALRYNLHWQLKISVADEEREVSGSAPVTILAPSQEQEARKERQLGTAGMKKNYDDLENAAGQAIQFVGQVLQTVAG